MARQQQVVLCAWCLMVLVTTAAAAAAAAPAKEPALSSSSSSSSSACTAPHPASAALHPFCSQPDSISRQARDYLKTMAVKEYASTRHDLKQAAKVQASFDELWQPPSDAARKEWLQDVVADELGGVPVLIATPKGSNSSNSNSNSSKQAGAAAQRLLLYIHGGGYVLGSCRNVWQVVAPTAQLAGTKVMCADYRRAPQHPFPAGLDDVLAVYMALLQDRGFAPSAIGLVGDSAGGGLLLALLQRLRASGAPLPGAVALMAPWCDLRRHGDSFTVLSGVDGKLNYDLNLGAMAEDYVAGNASKLSDPLVSPLLGDYAVDETTGSSSSSSSSSSSKQPFPPTLIQVGLRDSLLSTAVLLYRKMKAASSRNDVTFSPWEGMWHVFQANLDVPEALEAHRELAAHFTKHLAPSV